jgi:hypothetical protein
MIIMISPTTSTGKHIAQKWDIYYCNQFYTANAATEPTIWLFITVAFPVNPWT